MWFKEKFFKYGIGVLITLLIIFFLGQLDFFFSPVRQFIAILFFPILVSGLLYYLLRPLVRFAEKIHINRTIAILLVFVFVISLFTLMGSYAGSIISGQLYQLNEDLPGIIEVIREKADVLIKNESIGAIFSGNIQEKAVSALQNIVPILRDSILGAFSTVVNVASILVLVPFILFYFLKDDHLFSKNILKLVPKKLEEETASILEETDSTLSVYIIGQGILAVILGILMYLGYLIIGLKYSLILALFALITSFIPLFGSAIGIVPAVLVGLYDGPSTVLKIIILMLLVQQLEGNLISPFLIGKRLDIHPLTLILLFLVAASFYGFIGMLIAVPVYAVLKILAKNILRIYRLRT